jgi:hypothetical protein
VPKGESAERVSGLVPDQRDRLHVGTKVPRIEGRGVDGDRRVGVGAGGDDLHHFFPGGHARDLAGDLEFVERLLRFGLGCGRKLVGGELPLVRERPIEQGSGLCVDHRIDIDPFFQVPIPAPPKSDSARALVEARGAELERAGFCYSSAGI